jgi:hypothetical protein
MTIIDVLEEGPVESLKVVREGLDRKVKGEVMKKILKHLGLWDQLYSHAEEGDISDIHYCHFGALRC